MVGTRTALITGITGQDGSYLAEFLLKMGYEVHGLHFKENNLGQSNIVNIHTDLHLIPGDLGDTASVDGIISSIRPDEVYNLGAISSVPACEKDPIGTMNINGLGVVRLLQGIRNHSPSCRFFQASTSEIFGNVETTPQNEQTRLAPRNLYGISKLTGHLFVHHYRNIFNIHASNGILYNHESPRRGLEFVTRKISRGVVKIYLGLSNEIVLGNIDARRDWGYAPDYVEAMWRIVQHEEPDDFVIASGHTHSVRDLLDIAFTHVGISNWDEYVSISDRYWRPSDDCEMIGDTSRIRDTLGWVPMNSFKDMVRSMVDNDLHQLSKDTE